jgi:hypothetical protein
MDENEMAVPARRVAVSVRDACVHAALAAYERALGDGLCAEGAFECAIDAIRDLRIDALLQNLSQFKAR